LDGFRDGGLVDGEGECGFWGSTNFMPLELPAQSQ
jgi:hypothetical protein